MKLTVNDLFRLGVKTLNEANIEDAEFDARCLLESVLDIDTSKFFMTREETVDTELSEKYFKLINRRTIGEPLQYIIGKWEFYGNSFYVGEGVLIPRPETEMLVDEAKAFLSVNPSATVVDFCSGSGCIAISVAKLFPNAKVFAVEKYYKAYSYLLKNIASNRVDNVTAVKGDIFDKNILSDIQPDLLISNPPYIRSEDIKSLKKEVMREPHTALDGGNDGYDFYRVLCEYWFEKHLKSGSAMMLECAEDQGDTLKKMFSEKSLETKILNDYNGLQRVVIAYK